MFMEFKTARNANGHRKYLRIDPETRTYTTESPRMIIEGIEIKSKDYRELLQKCAASGYKRTSAF